MAACCGPCRRRSVALGGVLCSGPSTPLRFVFAAAGNCSVRVSVARVWSGKVAVPHVKTCLCVCVCVCAVLWCAFKYAVCTAHRHSATTQCRALHPSSVHSHSFPCLFLSLSVSLAFLISIILYLVSVILSLCHSFTLSLCLSVTLSLCHSVTLSVSLSLSLCVRVCVQSMESALYESPLAPVRSVRPSSASSFSSSDDDVDESEDEFTRVPPAAAPSGVKVGPTPRHRRSFSTEGRPHRSSSMKLMNMPLDRAVLTPAAMPNRRLARSGSMCVVLRVAAVCASSLS